MAIRLYSSTYHLVLCLSIALNIFLLAQQGRQPSSLKASPLTETDVKAGISLTSHIRGSHGKRKSTLEVKDEARLEDGGSGDAQTAKEGVDHHISKADQDEQEDLFPRVRPTARIRASHLAHVVDTRSDDDDSWSVYEDLTQRDGDIVFEHTRTKERKMFPKRSEPSFYVSNRKIARYGGLQLSKIGLDVRDLLADALLQAGEPDEQAVRHIVPPLGSTDSRLAAGRWSTFVGNIEANDNVALYGYGYTKSYHPIQYFPQLGDYTKRTYEGLLGGWMPAVRKILTIDGSAEYFEITAFGDTDVKDPFVVQTWHRTQHVRNGTAVKTVYGRSYPEFPRGNAQPSPTDFYRAFYRFSEYWELHLSDLAHLTLPDPSWVDLTRHAFVKELLVRPGGIYPKYGAIDRDYYGSEYDGFQDIFTSSLSANLEWGRFGQAWNVIENYLTMFVGNNGSINMRGPEVGQYGLTLSMLAKYVFYSGETDILWKHKDKIIGMAQLLVRLHDESLQLSSTNPGYGLIHGWSESDACLRPTPNSYWKPYFANSAMTIRGLRDISQLDMFREYRDDWTRRATILRNRLVEAVEGSILRDKQPPYVPPLPGTNLTFRESMAQEKPSPQDWPHRLYAELLHAAILPRNLTSLLHETMRSYGATSMGIVANVAEPSTAGRDILGFISYGYALSLLLNDRIDEFVLFLYSHRYHVHTRGSWTAGEVTDITGGRPFFCIPAQLTIPNIVRWALVLEHPDEEILYLGRGIPRAWLATGQKVGIRQAPTRWGRVDYVAQYTGTASGTQTAPGNASVSVDGLTPAPAALPLFRAQVVFNGRVPPKVDVKLRMPSGVTLKQVTVNGKVAELKNEAIVLILSDQDTTLNLEGT